MGLFWGSKNKKTADEISEQAPNPRTHTLTQYRGNGVTKSWSVAQTAQTEDGQAWFDDSNGNRTYLVGKFILEPCSFVETSEDFPRTHLVTVYEDGEVIRTFKVDIAKVFIKNGQIWWAHPVTGLNTIISGTFICAPIDLDVQKLGHYKPDHFLSLFQSGKTIARWAVRSNGIKNDKASIWFFDDFSKLGVFTCGEFAYEPAVEVDLIEPERLKFLHDPATTVATTESGHEPDTSDTELKQRLP